MSSTSTPIVQYVLLRKDLQKQFKYSLGSVIAQACHACIAANELYKSQPETIEYLANYQQMHKVVLQVEDEKALLDAEEMLKQNNLDYHKWMEHPEMLQTSIALRPYSKVKVEQIMKSFKLFR
ncbi:putative peptidyl-tRNA hydrolase PTRHD1 [Nilaparvata lugens]|uniref:putative peptidyl-tRNA hydrolase PTRHD1 n=1 Tax=Nilaparvata lugens TaxID=108931 RepID=UPI000B98701A|nr:putative peptidyl-tRNA hydrolase PTRHD1 [Nilaparvata lugens]